jgi:hypothetical protein
MRGEKKTGAEKTAIGREATRADYKPRINSMST